MAFLLIRLELKPAASLLDYASHYVRLLAPALVMVFGYLSGYVARSLMKRSATG
jgi:hypothetical protein